jgi:hypothetical protein
MFIANFIVTGNCLIKHFVFIYVYTRNWKRYSTSSKDEKIWCFFVKVATKRLKLACWDIPILIVILRQEFTKD